MGTVDVIAVIGSCPPERRLYAAELAEETHRNLVAATQLDRPNSVQHGVHLAQDTSSDRGVVIEFPSDASVEEIAWAFACHRPHSHPTNVICVVDASHLLDDLRRDDYFAKATAAKQAVTIHTARALITVTQIEHASTVVLANWENLPTDKLSTVMALVSHLNPTTRLRLRRESAPLEGEHHRQSQLYTQPGWAGLLNGNFSPHMTDNRVCGFRYENVRPLHPGRLAALLDERVEHGEFGNVVRSAGYCRFAPQPHITMQWEHVGRMIAFTPLINDNLGTDKAVILSFGQDLAVIGLDIDVAALSTALDGAALSDAEFAAGPMVWETFENPFPARQTVVGPTE